MKKVKLSDGREITVNKLTVKMMKAALKRESEIDQTISMISQTTCISESDIEDMPVEDFMLIQKEIESFLSVAGAAIPKVK